MSELKQQDLKLLTIWLSPSQNEIAHFIGDIFTDLASHTLYYIDATNSFPLRQFQHIVPAANTKVYDNIRITTCLDLQELSTIVNKIVQVLNMEKLKRHQNRNENDEPAAEQVQQHSPSANIIVLVNGLEIMFRNTQIKESPTQSHLILRDLLLKLRVMANSYQKDISMLRSLFIFPREDLYKLDAIRQEKVKNKRPKISGIHGNTLAEYIAKFYADAVI